MQLRACPYDGVYESYLKQVYFHYDNGTSTGEETFFDHLGVSNKDEAMAAVSDLCKSTQKCIEEHSFDDIMVDEGSQFVELYYSGRANWNEET